MPKTHLPAHLDSVREKCRPKHQLLILKCYPRLPKNSAADVKPNNSELSYLLYYASTRRSKLQKVGSFLERKTANDVYKAYSARVLVTLQILTALLENKVVGEGSALALIAPYVMRIISGILQNTNDVSLIAASETTWSAFCKHQDQTILAADREYRGLYEQVIRQYAQFAHKSGAKKLGKATTPVAVQDGIRLREIGLHAIKDVLTSDALAFESGRQVLNITVPSILSNLPADDASSMDHLVRASNRAEDDQETPANPRQSMANRRQSIATVRTHTGTGAEGMEEADPRAAEGTAQDADALAGEKVALVALSCLKALFATDNRAQVRSATSAVLNHLSEMQTIRRPQPSEKPKAGLYADSGPMKVLRLCTSWTPVQDRFILVVTAVETLIRLPLQEADLRRHLLYTNLVDDILRSDLNLIGLSVMDVLLGLIQQILRVLVLANVPVTPPTKNSTGRATTGSKTGSSSLPLGARLRLVERLKACMADLATHVYYTEQISDMVSAILFRLKPSPAPNGHHDPTTTLAAIEEPKSAVNEIASNIGLTDHERSSSTNGFFSFDAARQVALEIVRDIFHVTHSTRSRASGSVAENRSTIHISIWEGTQWLLHDPYAGVRKAYADALVTWLHLETNISDSRLPESTTHMKKQQEDSGGNGTLARRAFSNASPTTNLKERQAKKSQQTFLQLLHLASYETALQLAATSEADISIINTLLITLVQRLGVNAILSGLPMVLALQEEIVRIESPIGKVRVGSLVHGYLWALVNVFEAENDVPGQTILAEIERRRLHGIWVQEIQYPPLPLEAINETSVSHSSAISSEVVFQEALKPFDDRAGLVDCIVDHHQASTASPQPSTPGSPGRNLTLGAIDRRASGYLSAKQVQDPTLLGRLRDTMMATWSREDCLAAIAALAPKSVSLSGTRTSLNHNAWTAGKANHRNLLAAANTGASPQSSGLGTPPKAAQAHRQPALAALSRQQLQSTSPDRRPSGSSNGKGSSSAAARGSMRVDELKRVLASGGYPASVTGATHSPAQGHDQAEDTASDSMVEVDDAELGSDKGGSYVSPSRSFARRTGGGRTTRQDLSALLEGIHVGAKEEGLTTRVSMVSPPY